MKKRQIAFAGASVAMVLLTAACGSTENKSSGSANVQPIGGTQTVGVGATSGSGYGTSAGSGNEAGGDSGDSAESGKDALTGPAKQLSVRDVPKLGSVVTDSKGWTLYRFDEDGSGASPKSNCNDACATKWPPVPAADATVSTGIDKGKLGSVTRADGSKQLTLGGWPVYRFAGDTKAGDTKGHGVGGTWNALAPDGKPAGKEAAQDDSLQLSVKANAKLGKIVVDGQGMTVYRFDKDSAWPMKTGCLDACLETWKPVKPVDTSKVAGVDPKKLTSFTRPDGSKQLAFDCWLLYTFTGDTKPGDTNGQGKQGLWFAVTDKAKKAGVSASE